MGRAKTQIEPIKNDKKRSITFHRRKDGINKKAQELTKLCDVNIAVIICSDYQETPQIFPPDPSNFERLINLYIQNNCIPGKIQSYGLSDYFKDRKNKIEDELSKAKKKTREAKYPTWVDFLNDYSDTQLREFSLVLGNKIDYVKRKIEFKKISKIKNLDRYPFYPGNVLDSQSYLIPPLSNPSPMKMMGYNNFGFDQQVESYGNQNNPMIQSSNPNSENPISAMKIMGYQNNNRIIQSSNPNYENPISAMKMMMPLDYNNLGFDAGKLYDDRSNFITQSSNSDSLMNLLLSEDDNGCYNPEKFSCQPPPPEEYFYLHHGYGFPPEILLQPEKMPPLMQW